MSQPHDHLPLEAEFERRLRDFETQWITQQRPPQIDDYLSDRDSGNTNLGSSGQKLALELACVDLEFRWKLNVDPVVAEYYQHLFGANWQDVELVLIEHEYWSRHRWGDKPVVADFVDRFPHHADQIVNLTAAVAEQLQREFGSSRFLPQSHPPALSDHSLSGHARPGETWSTDQRIVEQAISRVAWPQRADFADYLLEKMIGSGLTGRVYRARHIRPAPAIDPANRLNDQSFVAIKFLRKTFRDQPDNVTRFIDELVLASRLKHPHIVPIQALGTTSGRGLFLVMPYFPRGDLSTICGATPQKIVHWCRQAAGAIAHCHAQGILHCDLKPGNLLLSDRDTIAVTDFGMAMVVAPRATASQLNGGTAIGGTAPFMAPEQVNGFWGEIGPTTDVYGLGAVMFALATGRPPQQGGSTAEIVTKVASGIEPPRLSPTAGLPEELCQLISACLHNRPAMRPQSASEVELELQRISDKLLLAGETDTK